MSRRRIVLLIIALVALVIGSSGTFFASTGPAVAQGPETPQSAPLNPDFEKYWENPPEEFYGYIPPPMDFSHLAQIPVQGAPAAAQALPSEFDWRDEGKVTAVKNQNTCGTCWIFGATSALESKVLLDESVSYDLSEQSVALCTDRSWVYLYDGYDINGNPQAEPCLAGGWSWLAGEVFIKKGAVLESCNSYNPSALNCAGACVCDSCTPVKKVNGYRLVTDDGSDISTIKNAIYTQGPVTLVYYHDFGAEYCDPTYDAIMDSYPCSPGDVDVWHLVSVIGWNDSVPHPNPSHGGTGAWIIKNSWGTADSWGGGACVSDGYFYLAYGSNCATEIAYFEYKDHVPGEELLYWDEAGLVTSAGYIVDDHAWVANVFTAPQPGTLTHVDFYTTSNNASYDIYVWDGSFGFQLHHQTGSCQEAGYYSIALSSPLPVSAAQQFTVGVEMTTPSFGYPIAVEQVMPDYWEPPIQTDVSFIRHTSSDLWQDLADYGWNGCLRARILTTPPQISVTPANLDFGSVEVGSYADETFTVENVGGGTLAGDATVPAPFSIEAGSPYSLTSGQTETVTVRFSPTAALLYSENVTFTGGGGATRPVTGTGYTGTLTLELEVGELSLNHNWQTVNLTKSFTDPVVVAKPLSYNGGHSCMIRIRNVTPTSFDIRIQEWDYLDGSHTSEQVSWLAMEKGHWPLPGGAEVEAGSINTNATGSFTSVNFSQAFSTTPVVMSSVTTFNESEAVVTRNKEITTSGFKVTMQEQELNIQSHATETISYVAWEPGTGTIDGMNYKVATQSGVNNTWSTVSYSPFASPPYFLADMQTRNGGDTCNIRYQNKTTSSVDIKIDEEQSADSEKRHYATEDVGYFAFSLPVSTVAVGEVSLNHNWQTVNLTESFTDPVVVAKPLSYNGGHSCMIRIRNVTPTSFDIRIQEWDYLDGSHISEQVSWLAMERGHRSLPGGAEVEAGSINTNATGSFTPVNFSQAFSTTPVVMSSVTTFNESEAVVTRNKEITTSGFKVTMQEQELNIQSHATETISYVAWEPGTGTVDGMNYKVATQSGVNNTWSTVSYSPFASPPYFLADMQTRNGGDTCNIRYQNKTTSSVDIKIDEEQSADSEKRHYATEDVGYFAFN